MLTTKVNDNQTFEIDNQNGAISLNGKPINANWIKIAPNKYHAIIDAQSLTIELGAIDETGKLFTILVNGVKYQVAVKNKYDQLLQQLGLDKMAAGKVNHIKAPMPGMVLRITTKVGDEVKKGDALLVLEAMKMENVIKSAGDGVVKKILAIEKAAVDKGQTLIEFE